MKRKLPLKWIAFCVIIAIAAFTVGFFAGEKVYSWVITPFYNADGIFDYGIFWTACGALSTFVVSIIAIWQSSRANNISEKLMLLESNSVRPYIKIGIGSVYYVNKDAYGFSKKVQELSEATPMWFEVTAPLKGYEQKQNCIWPIGAKFFFSAKNIGGSSISSISLKRFLVLNGGIGIVKQFVSGSDTSLFLNEEKEFVVDVKEQVAVVNNQFLNPISKEHKQLLESPIRELQIELGLEYNDVFGRTFYQEYTIHLRFSLQEENQTEYGFLIENPSIQHHTGKSPYGPRIDE